MIIQSIFIILLFSFIHCIEIIGFQLASVDENRTATNSAGDATFLATVEPTLIYNNTQISVQNLGKYFSMLMVLDRDLQAGKNETISFVVKKPQGVVRKGRQNYAPLGVFLDDGAWIDIKAKQTYHVFQTRAQSPEIGTYEIDVAYCKEQVEAGEICSVKII